MHKCSFLSTYSQNLFLVFLLLASLMGGEGNGTPLQHSCLEIPRTEEPGGPQSIGSLRVRQDWATSLSLFTFMHWRRKWQPTLAFLPGNPTDRGAWWTIVHGVGRVKHNLVTEPPPLWMKVVVRISCRVWLFLSLSFFFFGEAEIVLF